MYRRSESAQLLVAPRPQTAPVEAPEPETGMAYDAAATLACRTPVGTDTHAADGKAALVLSLLGIMFAVLARFGTEFSAILQTPGVVRIVCGVLIVGFVACSMCAVVQAFRTITPRFRRDKASLAFFAEIASLKRDEYFDRVQSLSMRDAIDQIALYNHTAARICAEKFRQLGYCLRCFETASVCWLVLALVFVFKSLHG